MYKSISKLRHLGSEQNIQVKTDVNKSKTDVPIGCERQHFVELCKTKLSTTFEDQNSPSSQDFTKLGNKLNKEIRN